LQIVDQPAVFPRLEVVQRGQHMTKIRQSLLISFRRYGGILIGSTELLPTSYHSLHR
jgi:hypothetical protein